MPAVTLCLDFSFDLICMKTRHSQFVIELHAHAWRKVNHLRNVRYEVEASMSLISVNDENAAMCVNMQLKRNVMLGFDSQRSDQ